MLYESVCFAESLKVHIKVLAVTFISFFLTEMEIPIDVAKASMFPPPEEREEGCSTAVVPEAFCEEAIEACALAGLQPMDGGPYWVSFAQIALSLSLSLPFSLSLSLSLSRSFSVLFFRRFTS